MSSHRRRTANARATHYYDCYSSYFVVVVRSCAFLTALRARMCVVIRSALLMPIRHSFGDTMLGASRKRTCWATWCHSPSDAYSCSCSYSCSSRADEDDKSRGERVRWGRAGVGTGGRCRRSLRSSWSWSSASSWQVPSAAMRLCNKTCPSVQLCPEQMPQ